MPQKLTATSNKSETLAIVSIESEDSGSGKTITHIRLGGMSPRANDMNGPERRMDESGSQANGLRGQTGAPNVSNHAGTTGISHGDEPNTYLGAGGVKRGVDMTDGIESHTDALSGHGDAQSIQMDTITTVSAPEIISTHPIEPEMPDLPS